MTTHDHENTAAANGDAIGQLLKLAGPRRMPDAAQIGRARAAAHAEWTAQVQQRARRRVMWMVMGAAMAASVIGGLGWPWIARQRVPAGVRLEIANVRTVTGPVFLVAADGRRSPLAAGARIGAGERVETSNDGRAAFAMNGGVSMRLDQATAIVFDARGEVTLASGAAYVDSGDDASATSETNETRAAGERGAADSKALEITTAFGKVSHVGTQFEVRLQDSSMRVLVREGTVAVERGGTRWTSQSGEALMLSRSGPPVRAVIPTSGPEWKWVADLAEPFRLEGARATAFLHWVSREQGWRWQLEDPRMLDRIERIVLHGSIDTLTPEEALAAVLPTCGLTFRLEGERLVIGVARKP